MDSFLKWVTRLLVLLTLICAVSAGIMYFSMSADGLDGAGATAILYATLVGTIGFGVSALAAFLIRKNFSQS